MVTVSRAGHFLRGQRPLVIEDPYAIHFIGARWRWIVTSSVLEWIISRVLLRKLRPTVTGVLIRARFAEDRILDAARRGVGQLVILGAGFDTFALRYPNIGMKVFEVDLPATEALKRGRLAAAEIPIPRQLHFVSVDFERDDFARKLTEAGFDPAQPAFFNWMGVTYYLEKDAIRATLAKLGNLAAAGSELTLDYMGLRECLLEKKDRVLFDGILQFVAKYGEPMVSQFDPASVQQEMGLVEGWELMKHEFPAEESESYLKGRTDLAPAAPFFRLLHLMRKE